MVLEIRIKDMVYGIEGDYRQTERIVQVLFHTNTAYAAAE
jgi:hypothetical protein